MNLDYLVNDGYNGKFEYSIKNEKSRPGHTRNEYTTKSKRQKTLTLQLSADDRASVEQKLIALRSVKPAGETIEQIRTLHIETYNYRRNFLQNQSNAAMALTTFPRLSDTPELLLLDFEKFHEADSLNVNNFMSEFPVEWAPHIVAYAITKRPPAIFAWREDPALEAIVTARDLSDISDDVLLEAAFKVLPFLLPGLGKRSGAKEVVRMLMLTYKDLTFDEIRQSIQSRAERIRANKGIMCPLLVKYVRNATTSFYIALDGKLLETHSDLTRAIVLLVSTYTVFWCKYPAALKSVYRCLEFALGIKKGLGLTPSLSDEIKKIKSEKLIFAHNLDENSL